MAANGIVTGAEFAEMCGLSRSAVSRALNRGKLSPAKAGKSKINTLHPAAKAYIQSAAQIKAGYAAGRKKRGAKSAVEQPDEPAGVTEEEAKAILDTLPPDIRAVGELTVYQVVAQHGTEAAFVEFLKAVEKIEKIHKVRLENAAEEGKLIDRELVKRGVIEPLDTAHKKLLSDGARSIAQRIVAMAEAGRSVSDCEAFVSEHIGSFIRGAKLKAVRALKGA
jgi:hypothetical protein